MNRSIRITRRGLSLLELMVVLAILAVLATVAAVTTNQLVEQARYDGTQKTLENMRVAVVGTNAASSTDVVESAESFVADVGRPPISLEELLVNTNSLPAFGLVAPVEPGQPNDDVRVPRGWRGPYLRLPPGATTIRDGWGREIQATFDTSPAYLSSVFSLGADGELDAVGGIANYNRDTVVLLAASAYQGVMITGKLYGLSGGQRVAPTGGNLALSMFGPDPTGTGTNGVQAVAATLTKTINPTTLEVIEVTYVILTPTIGPKVLRATITPSGGSPAAAGTPTYVVVRPGEALIVDLRVQ